MAGDSNRTTTAAAYVVVVAAALVTAAALAPVVYSSVPSAGDDEPDVAVITFRGGTTNSNVAAAVQSLREVRNNDSVEAVVIRIDSPGGPVDASEEFYLAVNRTAREMPVVAYVEGTAASGGYFGITPADRIVVKPSSSVGSIGVIVQAPVSLIEDVEQQRELFLRSGPDKAQITRDGLREDIELLQRAFVETVLRHRGDELTLSREEVASGSVFLGTRAVENGFADRVGDLNTAIEAAASESDAIEGDGYDVYYKNTNLRPVNVIVLANDTQRVEGNIVYVDQSDQAESEFVEPVKYYYLWGVPRSAVENTTGVTADG